MIVVELAGPTVPAEHFLLFLRLDLLDALDLVSGVNTETVVAASISKTNFTSLGPRRCLPWTDFLFGKVMIPVGGLKSI